MKIFFFFLSSKMITLSLIQNSKSLPFLISELSSIQCKLVQCQIGKRKCRSDTKTVRCVRFSFDFTFVLCFKFEDDIYLQKLSLLKMPRIF